LQTLQYAFLESADRHQLAPKFPILKLVSMHVEAFDNTVLLWLTKEFLLPDITTYRHRRN